MLRQHTSIYTGEIEEDSENVRTYPPFGRRIKTGIREHEGRSTEIRIRSQVSLCDIFDGQTDSVIDIFHRVLLCSCVSIIPPMLHTH